MIPFIQHLLGQFWRQPMQNALRPLPLFSIERGQIEIKNQFTTTTFRFGSRRRFGVRRGGSGSLSSNLRIILNSLSKRGKLVWRFGANWFVLFQ